MELDQILGRSSPWVSTLVVAAVAVAVAAALAVLQVGALLLRRATAGSPVLHATVLETTRPAAFALPLAAFQLVLQAAAENTPHIDGLRHLTGLLLIAACTWTVTGAIRGLSAGVIASHPYDVDDNLQARRVMTQARVLGRTAILVALITGVAMMLMTFPGARQVGASLLASAGVLGIVAGLAAKPVFSNLIAGLQIALAQPIRIDDVLIVQDEWGKVEEITGTYVVLKIWDERRLIIPLQWFIENPFQNWTRTESQLMGSVFLNVDFGMPLAPIRAELERLMPTFPQWDRRFFNLQVTDTTEKTMQLRVLVTAVSSGLAFDLRCNVREALISFMQREFPQYLPTLRFSAGASPRPSGSMDKDLRAASPAEVGLADSPGVPQV